jgi:hypothetical protein
LALQTVFSGAVEYHIENVKE